MTVFAAAVDALFADPNIARDALFVAGGGEAVLVRVIERRPDVVSEFAGGRIASATAVFDLRVSEVAAPHPGDRIEIPGSGPGQAGEAFLVQGEPRRDPARLVWTLEARPA